MKHSSSAVRKFICRWIGILLLLLPFIGVPKTWKDSVIFIFAILLIFASFSVRRRNKVIEVDIEDEDKAAEAFNNKSEFDDEENNELEYEQEQRPL
jgi:hypothetical protein